MSEKYSFEYVGAVFEVTVEDGGAETSEAANLRTIEGTWKTWRIEVDPNSSGIQGLRLLRCVGPNGEEHASGNLSPAASGPGEFGQMMITSDGYMYTIPTGWGVVGRMFTPNEWAVKLAEWEEQVHAGGNRV